MKKFDIYLEKTIDWYVQNSKWLLNKYNSRKMKIIVSGSEV